jgi:hypothetical protein
MQVQHLQFCEVGNIFDLREVVFGNEQHFERGQSNIFDVLDEVVVEIEVQDVWQGNEVLYFADFVVLESQHLQLLLALQQRNVGQLQTIQVELLHIRVSLHWPPITNPHIRNLRQFRKDDVSRLLNLL